MGSRFTDATHSRGLTLIPFAKPRPPLGSRTVTRNGFKDCWLVPQITTNLSSMLRYCSYAAWETCHEVTHPKIASQQARLVVKFLRVSFPKIKVHLWWYKIVTPRMWVKIIEVTIYTTKCASLFLGNLLLRTSQLSVFVGEQSGMGDLLWSFSSSMWARTKHARKIYSDLWGQATILEAVSSNCPGPRRGLGRYNPC